ncbi:MAG: hypothetical protein V1731_02465 [Candidatus Aenigmatarchaeota archaeon]
MTDWGKTKAMRARLEREHKIERRNGVDYYQGRRIIERDSPIDNGVYLGSGQREAVFVDFEKGVQLKKLYEQAKARATEGNVIDRSKVLKAVYDVVSEAMPNGDEKSINDLLTRYGVKKDGMIILDVFIGEKQGICRHYELASAALVERFIKNGILRGKVSVDRNETADAGHGWCRYTSRSGEVAILDAALGYFGLLKDAPGRAKWDYRRPADR